MTLYTIQPLHLYENLILHKSLLNTGDFINDYTKEFLDSYNWMVEQMLRYGLSKPKKSNYPFWAWYKYSSEKNKPDLRHSAHAPRDTKCVCLELEISDNLVLLSNFDLWHCVLNNIPIFDDSEWDKKYAEYKKLSTISQNKIKKGSWEKIFTDLTDSPIQATFWELKNQDIKDVRFFTAR